MSVLSSDVCSSVLVVDCRTLWLSNLFLSVLDVESQCGLLVDALPRLAGPVILVSNEVGLGIVPDNALARRFRDEAGRLNQAVAAAAQSVVFVAAGLPLVLKQPDCGPAQTRSQPPMHADIRRDRKHVREETRVSVRVEL